MIEDVRAIGVAESGVAAFDPADGPRGSKAQTKLLMGERDHRQYPLNAATVDYIESDGNYVTIHAVSSTYISRDSLKRLSAELADLGFVRIERSLLVNIGAVAYVESAGRGRFAFTLASGSRLHSGACYRDSILRVLPMRRLSSRR
jgi:two-component system, LytTR family, response regulator